LFSFLKMDLQQILNCQFGSWYPNFRDVAFRSAVIPLHAAFVEFLVEDGVFLTADSNAVRLLNKCPGFKAWVCTEIRTWFPGIHTGCNKHTASAIAGLVYDALIQM